MYALVIHTRAGRTSNKLTCIGRVGRRGGSGKLVDVRLLRRVRMGKKDEVGSPYILSPL